jgi:SOS-response transcriptional repressor LexA
MDELTDIQRRVFDFIRDKLVAGRPAPTAREVAAKFGWSSKRAAECHFETLIRQGWLCFRTRKSSFAPFEEQHGGDAARGCRNFSLWFHPA